MSYEGSSLPRISSHLQTPTIEKAMDALSLVLHNTKPEVLEAILPIL